jgi:hypothetical protein
MSKAQADIISSVLIVIISLSLVASAYTWGNYLIEKNKGTTIIERVEKYFDRTIPSSVASRIEEVAVSGAEITFSLDVDGIWTLNPCSDSTISSSCIGSDINNNTITFSFRGKATDIKPNAGWIPDNCGIGIGLLGKDPPSVVCKRADTSGDSYNTTYKLWIRELDDSLSNPTTGIKYLLIPAQNTRCQGTYCASAGKSIQLSRGTMTQTIVDGKNLITTEIKVLFV